LPGKIAQELWDVVDDVHHSPPGECSSFLELADQVDRDSPTPVYSDDWLPEQGGFEPRVARRLCEGKLAQMLEIFRVAIRWHLPENAFVFSSYKFRR
jgi:hypothetical protein